jgi:hypothetical protein
LSGLWSVPQIFKEPLRPRRLQDIVDDDVGHILIMRDILTIIGGRSSHFLQNEKFVRDPPRLF